MVFLAFVILAACGDFSQQYLNFDDTISYKQETVNNKDPFVSINQSCGDQSTAGILNRMCKELLRNTTAHIDPYHCVRNDQTTPPTCGCPCLIY